MTHKDTHGSACTCHSCAPAPVIHGIKREAGIAGQFAVTADIEYPGEDRSKVTFVGSTYGGPVVMRTPSGLETFVADPARFGKFGTEWARRFFAECR